MTDRRNERATLKRAIYVVECLKKSFEGMKVTDITTDRINAHSQKRTDEGLSNATINENWQPSRTMFKMGAR